MSRTGVGGGRWLKMGPRGAEGFGWMGRAGPARVTGNRLKMGPWGGGQNLTVQELVVFGDLVTSKKMGPWGAEGSGWTEGLSSQGNR